MRTYTKLLFASVAAAAFLAMAIGSASANRLSVSETEFEIFFIPEDPHTVLTFSAPSVGAVIECPVTMLGHFDESTIIKEEEERVGIINHASVGSPEECVGGEATIQTETLPWQVNYEAFTGTLPRITGVELALIGVHFLVDPDGVLPTCEAGTTLAHPGRGVVNIDRETGAATGLRADETEGIPLGGSFLCSFAGSSFFEGLALVTNLAGDEAIFLTLI